MTVSIRCLHATSISVFSVLFSRHSYNTDRENLFSQVVAAAAEAISECVVKKEVRQSRLLIVSLRVHRDEEFFSDIPRSVIGLFCPYSTNQMQPEFNMNFSYQVFLARACSIISLDSMGSKFFTFHPRLRIEI